MQLYGSLIFKLSPACEVFVSVVWSLVPGRKRSELQPNPSCHSERLILPADRIGEPDRQGVAEQGDEIGDLAEV